MVDALAGGVLMAKAVAPYDLESMHCASGCVAEHADVLEPLQAGEGGAVVGRLL
jgi:hypothetical protein